MLYTRRILVLTTFIIIINVFHVKTTDLRESLVFPGSQNFNSEEKASRSGLLIDYNITKLDTKNDTTSNWKISRLPTTNIKWFSYYINTLQFTSDSNKSCASVVATSELSFVNGIWTACQDPILPKECGGYDGLDCHPSLKYDDRTSGQLGRIRTVKLNVAFYGWGILRFWAGQYAGPNIKCFDYSVKKDPFSQCEFRESKPAPEISGGWQEIFYYTSEKDTISKFQIDMIARFKQDMILLDKIEASEERLCEDCTTLPPTTPTASNTKTTSGERSSTSATTTPLITSTGSSTTLSETSSTPFSSSSASTLVTSNDPSQTTPTETSTATGTIPDVTVNTSSTSEDLLTTTTTKASPNVASSMLYHKIIFLHSLVLCLIFL